MNYIEALAAEIKDEVPNHLLPEGDSDSLFLVYAVLALAKGTEVTTKDVHDAWAAWMTAQNPNHPSVRPYGELAEDVRDEDEPFANAIRKVAEQLD